MNAILLAPLLCLPVADASSDTVIPVVTGDPSPSDGLFVPEGRFVRFLEAEAEVADLKVRLQIQVKYSEGLEQLYRDAIKKTEVPWYRSLTLNRLLSFGLGVGAAILSVWVGVQIVRAVDG